MKLYTLGSNGVVDGGIEAHFGQFYIGSPNDTIATVKVLDNSCGWRVASGKMSNGYLISTSNDETDEVGLLIRCQAKEGERWWLRGNIISECPLNTEKPEYFTDCDNGSHTECPFCYYSTSVPEHCGYTFQSQLPPNVEIIKSGFVRNRGPEEFIRIKGNAVFSIHKLFVPDSRRDIVVEVKDGDINLWTPDRYLENLKSEKPEIFTKG